MLRITLPLFSNTDGTACTTPSVAPALKKYRVSVLAQGNWRSWLARFLDMEEVTGSNPVLPTASIKNEVLRMKNEGTPSSSSHSLFLIPNS